MKAAIYARLSREDEEKIDGNNDSRSIENQIKTLTNYANEHHLEIANIYYDDGYSGSNLDRPGFQKMINDAKNKQFNILLIKDLSRLGRKLYQVGTLVEKTLPQMGIRLIAINDNYDAATYKDDESVVLRNFLNDYYLKEFRRKCRASLAHRAQTVHINYYPKYGYIYDSEGNEQIDPYASDIVKLIFELVPKHGMSGTARYLNDEGILTRSQYQTQVLKLKPLNKKPAVKWSASAVSEVVSDYEYCGHIVNLVRKKEPPIIIKNKRLSIVTEEEYELANKKRLEHKNELESRKNKLDFIYDINGKKLIYSKDEYGFYYTSKTFQLREKTLIKMLYTDAILVLEKIKKDTNKFYQILVKRITATECKIPKQELEKKLKNLDAEYAKLLENYFLQKVTSKYFEKMSKELNDKMNAIKDLLNASTNIKTQVALLERKFSMFLELIKEAPRNEIELIRMMIERVEINKTADKQYDVKIKYKFEL